MTAVQVRPHGTKPQPLDVTLEWDEEPGGPVLVEFRGHRWIVPNLEIARREAERCLLGLVIAGAMQPPREEASPWWAVLLFGVTLLAAAWAVGALP